MSTPQSTPPSTDEAYIVWARGVLGVDYNDPSIKLAYSQNSTFVQATAQDHPFFKGLDEFLRESSEEYRRSHNAELFMGEPSDRLDIKSFASAVNKSFRHNVVLNDNFPNAPEADWVTPANWFTVFDDIVRTTIVCKFIDGPYFLAQRLHAYASRVGLNSVYSSHQKDRGYYAYHFYVEIPVQLLISGTARDVGVKIEIQLTTQLQEILYKITHKYYEHLRNERVSDRGAWKWEFGSNRFRAGYLSHTLHLLEAIILEVRDSEETPSHHNEHETEPAALADDPSLLRNDSSSAVVSHNNRTQPGKPLSGEIPGEAIELNVDDSATERTTEDS